MKIRPAALFIGVLAAAAFFGAGVFVGRHWLSHRLTAEAEETAEPARAQKHYWAVTKFLINPPPALSSGVPANWFQQEFKTLTSHDLLKEVARKLHLETKWAVASGEASSRLERMVDAERERGTEIVNLSARSPDRDEAVQIANAVRLAYEDYRKARAEDAVLSLKTLQDKIELQASKVEKARMEMVEVMKKHNIIDQSLASSVGAGDSDGIELMKSVTGSKEQLEQDLVKIAIQSKVLQTLKGEALLSAFQGLNIRNAIIDRIGPEYRVEKEQLARAIRELGAGHAEIKARKESIQSKLRQLLEAAESYKVNLEVRLKGCQEFLARQEALIKKLEHSSEEEREKQAEYRKVKYTYESQLALMSSMKEYSSHAGARVTAPGEKSIELLQAANLLEPEPAP